MHQLPNSGIRVYVFKNWHCPLDFYYADLATEQERQLMTGKHMESTELEFRCPIYTTLPLVKPVAWLSCALSTDVAVLLLNQPIIIDRVYRWKVEQDFHRNFLVKLNGFLGFFSGQFVCRNWPYSDLVWKTFLHCTSYM